MIPSQGIFFYYKHYQPAKTVTSYTLERARSGFSSKFYAELLDFGNDFLTSTDGRRIRECASGRTASGRTSPLARGKLPRPGESANALTAGLASRAGMRNRTRAQ